jgi:hypothetical protein
MFNRQPLLVLLTLDIFTGQAGVLYRVSIQAFNSSSTHTHEYRCYHCPPVPLGPATVDPDATVAFDSIVICESRGKPPVVADAGPVVLSDKGRSAGGAPTSAGFSSAVITVLEGWAAVSEVWAVVLEAGLADVRLVCMISLTDDIFELSLVSVVEVRPDCLGSAPMGALPLPCSDEVMFVPVVPMLASDCRGSVGSVGSVIVIGAFPFATADGPAPDTPDDVSLQPGCSGCHGCMDVLLKAAEDLGSAASDKRFADG